MNTLNKVHVVERNPHSPERTSSGGVREPSDPAHYPKLGASKDAITNVAQSGRRLSRTTSSFKEKVLLEQESSLTKLEVGTEGPATNEEQSASSPSMAPPKIAAGRTVQRDEVQGNSSTREVDRLQLPAGNQQAVLRTGTQQDSWQVVSPKKAVTQRGLTADEQAEHKAKENTIYDIPASSNAFEVLKQDEQLTEENLEEEEQEEVSEMAVFPGKPTEEVEELEETEAEPGATPHHRSRWDSLRNMAQETVGMVKEYPMATIVTVAMVSIGWSLIRRRR